MRGIRCIYMVYVAYAVYVVYTVNVISYAVDVIIHCVRSTYIVGVFSGFQASNLPEMSPRTLPEDENKLRLSSRRLPRAPNELLEYPGGCQ